MEAPCTRFTAAEGGARLAAVACQKNTLIVEYVQFVSTRLIYEQAYKVRGSMFDGKQRSVYVTRASRIDVVAYELAILTDLNVGKATKYDDVYDWSAELDKKEVLVCTSSVLHKLLEEHAITMPNINVLIIDSCHLIYTDESLKYIMKMYKECEEQIRPRILALTYPIFTTSANSDEKCDETSKSNGKGEESDIKSVGDIEVCDDIRSDEKEIVSIDEKQTDETTTEKQNNETIEATQIDETVKEKQLVETTKEKQTNTVEEKQTNETIPEKQINETKSIEQNQTKETKTIEETQLNETKPEQTGTETKSKDIKNLTEARKVMQSEKVNVCMNLDDFEMYEKLEWKIEELEKELSCQMDLAEDIDGGKRLSGTTSKPKEYIVEFAPRQPSTEVPEDYATLEQYMRDTVHDVLEFIDEHRYDPTEIYGEELYDEFKNIPDPTLDPRSIFYQFLYVLDELGPYGADKAAFSLLTKLEKLKIKVPYERHFLLLCLCTTVFVKIRCYADDIFSKYESDWDKIRLFCTPKVLRLAEILEKYEPPEHLKEIIVNKDFIQNKDVDNDSSKICKDNSDGIKKLEPIHNTSYIYGDNVEFERRITEITDENYLLDLTKDLSNTINDIKSIEHIKDQTIDASNKLDVDIQESNDNSNETNKTQEIITENDKNTNKLLKEIDKLDFVSLKDKIEDKVNILEANLKELNDEISLCETKSNVCEVNMKAKDSEVKSMEFPQKHGSPIRRRNRRVPRRRVTPQQPNSLCGLLVTSQPLMAKILFIVTVDLSRCVPRLSFLCAQYCATESPQDLKTSQNAGKKQEEVLKKFRMHECNLLLATPALEEGIDLPRCNLVIRWDVPTSYRSHVVSRGRARAPRACCLMLANCQSDDTDVLLHNLAVYSELDQIISRKCGCGIQNEPPQTEESQADTYTRLVSPYTPNNKLNTHIKHTNDKITEIYDKDNGINSRNENNDRIDKDNDHIINSKINDINTDDQAYENKVDINAKDSNSNNDITDNVNKDLNDANNDTKIPSNTAIDQLTNAIKSCNINDSGENNGMKFNDNDSKMNGIIEYKVENEKKDEEIACVDLNSAIALINRYCGKLPSDTFTRLAPQYWTEQVMLPADGGVLKEAYICTLRLPLNCPVKYNIVGHPMPTRVLARRMVALQACRILHKSGELDDQLMPIGKENFKAAEIENANVCNSDQTLGNDNARPGTTKRRQYYYKRTAKAFTNCQPVIDTTEEELKHEWDPKKRGPLEKGEKRNTLYAIVSQLWCALPERYNTRGRRLHAPQFANQAIGLLLYTRVPSKLQVPPFPVYTRSGEVRVSVEPAPFADVRITKTRDEKIKRFMHFVFSDVLRVRRRGMQLCTEGSKHNNYYIVPTIKSTKNGQEIIDIDWSFLDIIYKYTEEKTHEIEKPIVWQEEIEPDGKRVRKVENPLLKKGEVFQFDAEKYKEAVVTPWYRNQDQPQFFLVAEICWSLTPDSAFPSLAHTTFREYYLTKYGVTITQREQPLLDVDHTSARLNLLTPRYVNRKGVALPVSSERTRRAKRDRLDQKQILVAELCRVHPFAAPLHCATVALPCVLYRINALLIADEIRKFVAKDVGLGIPKIDEKTGFQWPPLDFGWSLAEVLSADSEKNEKKKTEDDSTKEDESNEKEQPEDNSTEDNKEPKEKTINDILQEKEAESGFEIGTWSNDMASSIPETDDYDDYNQPLPPNLTLCTSASGGANWCDTVEKPKNQFNPSKAYSMADSDCSYMSSDFDTDDSDLNSMNSDEDDDTSGFCSSKNSNAAMGVRIEYKTAHEAEAVDLEKEKVNPAPQLDQADEETDRKAFLSFIKGDRAPEQHIEKFHKSIEEHKQDIINKGFLINQQQPIDKIIPEPFKDTENTVKCTVKEQNVIVDVNLEHTTKTFEQNVNLETVNAIDAESHILKMTDQDSNAPVKLDDSIERPVTIANENDKSNESINCLIKELFPYGIENVLVNGQITLENVEKNKRKLLIDLKNRLNDEEIRNLNCFSMKDVDIDSPNYVNEKKAHVGFDSKEKYVDKLKNSEAREFVPYYKDNRGRGKEFDFDYQPDLEGHPGPSPSVILQALTMSNANDGINLERLETIGDSFLKFAITAYLYCAHPTVHEGKLSHMRSKQVSNLNLYRLGRNKRLGARMIASKFEPHDNWLPPCHKPPETMKHGPNDQDPNVNTQEPQQDSTGCFIPYNLITQHSIPDKSIADCVEALIGAYLLECGPRGALLFMSWLGITVLPAHIIDCQQPTIDRGKKRQEKRPPKTTTSDSETSSSEDSDDEELPPRMPGALHPYIGVDGKWYQPVFGELKAPPSPLLRYISDPDGELERMLSGYEGLERTLQYRFRDRSLLLQAMTHASHYQNTLTDCYQRLEFLGDAILDYLITRHLYEDPRRHSPGALTDLRSALVNNTIFATLAARHGFHKYFRHMSPGLNEVLTKYVKIQEENGHSISEEHYLIQEDEMEQAEDVEVPKALGDLFESVAGAIFLDSGMSLGAVWKSYVNLMGAELEAFSAAAPKSPVRELLEAEPDTAKFGKPERLADGRRVRVCVEVFGRGSFKGVGRNYRIAKGTAARCALRHLNIVHGNKCHTNTNLGTKF